MVRLVLFDIDGTLIRTGGAGVQAFGHALAMEFKIPNGADRLSFSGRTDTALARELFLQHQIEPSPESFRRFFGCYVFWLDYLLTQTRGGVIAGVWEFIGRLHALPEPPAIGLLTGNIRLGAEIKLRHFELWEIFQTGAFADDHEDRNQIAAIAQQRGSRLLNDSLRGDRILVIELQDHRPDWLAEDLTKVKVEEVCLLH